MIVHTDWTTWTPCCALTIAARRNAVRLHESLRGVAEVQPLEHHVAHRCGLRAVDPDQCLQMRGHKAGARRLIRAVVEEVELARLLVEEELARVVAATRGEGSASPHARCSRMRLPEAWVSRGEEEGGARVRSSLGAARTAPRRRSRRRSRRHVGSRMGPKQCFFSSIHCQTTANLERKVNRRNRWSYNIWNSLLCRSVRCDTRENRKQAWCTKSPLQAIRRRSMCQQMHSY